MKTSNNTYLGTDTRHRVFTYTKYLVYVLLSFNVYLFLQEELLALTHTFTDGIKPGEIIQAFSATIDTAAWVLLLLMFELETSVLDDRKIQGPVKWSLHGLRGLCYLALSYAFTGYYEELVTLYQVTALSATDACSLLDSGYSLLIDLDEYLPLDAVNCAAASTELYTVDGFDILADGETLRAAQWLAWVDVINAADWILVVIVLEIEVRLQLRGKLTGRVMGATKILKFILYGILFACAAYWGVAGDFLDFWDAALWLFAFIFIELNVFEWQNETEMDKAASSAE
jgi:hypothetical protein